MVRCTQLGIKVLRGEVIEPDSLKELWPGKTFSHSGSQRGAKSFWRIGFDDELVIVVLSNQSSGKPGSLTKRLVSIAEAHPNP